MGMGYIPVLRAYLILSINLNIFSVSQIIPPTGNEMEFTTKGNLVNRASFDNVMNTLGAPISDDIRPRLHNVRILTHKSCLTSNTLSTTILELRRDAKRQIT